MATSYTWVDFDLGMALQGSVVGFEQTDASDLSMTGKLGSDYSVMLKGTRVYVDALGVVIKTVPNNQALVGLALKMPTATMAETIGSDVEKTRAAGSGEDQDAHMSNVEARDQFAIAALKVIMDKQPQPWALDDASIISYARHAYRWAEAMMQVGADSRDNQTVTPGQGTQSEDVDMTGASTSEKLLNNIVASLDKLKEQIDTRVAAKVNDATRIIEGASVDVTVSILNHTHVQFVFDTYRAFSDLSVLLNLAVTADDGTTSRTVGFIIPKGSTTFLGDLDDAVTNISAINSITWRGAGYDDTNIYNFSQPSNP